MSFKEKVFTVGGEDVHARIPLLLEYKRLGYEVGAVGSGPNDRFKKHGIPYFRYELNRGIAPFADLKSIDQLQKIFASEKPTVVHGFDTKPANFAPIAAQKAGVPVRVRTVTGMGYIFSSDSLKAKILKPIYNSLQKRGANASCTTIFQNPDDREYFLSHGICSENQSEIVLSSGLDLDEFDQHWAKRDPARIRKELGVDESVPVITFVARMVKTKGVAELREAANILKSNGQKFHMVLVGPTAGEPAEAVPESWLDDFPSGTWLRQRSDIIDILSASNLFVLPSYYREGVPRVLLEAAAASLPLVTTKMPGCKEMISYDLNNGKLVEPRSAKSLADGIAAILDLNAADRASMGERSRKHLESGFTLRQVSQSYVRIYEKYRDQIGAGNGI